MATQEQIEQLVQLYVGYFDRAPDPAGLTYWINELDNNPDMGFPEIAKSFSEQPEARDKYPYLSNPDVASPTAFITTIYLNLFNRTPDDEGLAYWENELANGKHPSQMIIDVMSGATDSAAGNDLTTLNNKTAVGWDFAQTMANVPGLDYENNPDAQAAASGVLDGVDDTDASVDEAMAETDAYFVELTTESADTNATLGVDNLNGTGGPDVFNAGLAQNELGAVTNTFESGDSFSGGEGMDVMNVDLTHTVSGGVPVGPAISASSDGIEVFNFREQVSVLDTNFNPSNLPFSNGNPTSIGSNIDAQNMSGVEQWWTDNSRSNIQIEDIRSNPSDTAFGLNETDPYAGLYAFFNARYLSNEPLEQTTLDLVIQQIEGGDLVPGVELTNITVSSITISVGETEYVFDSAEVQAANTWAELEVAIDALIAAEPELEGLVFTHNGDGEFTFFDPTGRDLEADPETAVLLGFTGIDVRNEVEPGGDSLDQPTRTSVYLDDAGNGSEGGAVNIAGMSGTRGVEIMDVIVDDDSHISTLRSVNRGDINEEEQLEEVYVARGNADGTQNTGDLKIGHRTTNNGGEESTVDGRLTTGGFSNNTPVQNAFGLNNVRVFDAEGFDGNIMLAADLNNGDVFDKYLDPADAVVEFTYHLGDAGNNLSLNVDNNVSADDLFSLDLIGGDMDDRINLTGLATKDTTTVDGEGGDDIVEVTTSIGTSAANTWENFVNVEHLVVAGTSGFVTDNAIIDVLNGNMTGLEDVVIETDGNGGAGDNTTVRNLAEDQDTVISGAAQSIVNNNDNNGDQRFGNIVVDMLRAVPGVGSHDILLNNTARTDGQLIVNDLDVTNPEPGVGSVTLHSNGQRDTSNFVNDMSGPAISEVLLEGSQDLSLHISSLAAGGAATVDGSGMTGNLTLALNSAVLNNGPQDMIVGTDGELDELQLYGPLNTNASISEFETVRFGEPFAAPGAAASGLFDGANTNGVGTYILDLLNGPLTMENLRGDEDIIIDYGNNDALGQDLAFVKGGNGVGSELNLLFRDEDGNDGLVNHAATEISVDGYRTVNMDFQADMAGDNFVFDLDILDDNGNAQGNPDPLNAYDPNEADARVLNVSGGDENDTIDFETFGSNNNDRGLYNTFSTIDFSDYAGEVTARIRMNDDPAPIVFNRNVEVVMNGNHMDLLEGRNQGVEDRSVVTYTFTQDNDDANGTDVKAGPAAPNLVDMTEAFIIDQFEGFGVNGTAAGDLSDLSVLDLSALGISNLAEISIHYESADGDITDDGTDDDIIITANDPVTTGLDFVIVLEDADTSGGAQDVLTGDNFIFA